MHTGEDVAVIGDACQHQPVIAEGIGNAGGHIVPCQVVKHHLLPQLFQLPSQLLGGSLGMTVDGGVGNHNARFLRAIGRPDVVFFDVMPQVLLEDGSMEGADGFNFQAGCLLQQLLHLHSVLAHDADVIAAGFIVPRFFCIQCAELAEAVGGEQHLVGSIVAHHHLGPMHHGRKHKGQAVLAQGQGLPVGDRHLGALRQGGEELPHHHKGLGVAHQGCLGIALQKQLDVGGMVRLHMLHHQIIRLSVSQHGGDVFQPLCAEVGIHRVHDGNLLVQNHIGVVRHAAGHHILPLEQVNLMVVDTYITNIIGNHVFILHFYMFFEYL